MLWIKTPLHPCYPLCRIRFLVVFEQYFLLKQELHHTMYPYVVLAFTNTVDSFQICRKRKYTCFTLPPLRQAEMAKMIENFLGHYCKSLSPSQSTAIISKEACASPVFLRTVLEELRIFGVFEELTNRIQFYTYTSLVHPFTAKILTF
jgi:hypothetical protein